MIKLLIASLVLVSAATAARPTQCEPNSVEDSFHDAAAVFSGRLISQEYQDAQEAGLKDWREKGAIITKFKIERWWKGGVAEEVTVHTPAAKVGGGIMTITEQASFTAGKEYLVYALGPPEQLVNRGCSRTKELKHAEDDLRVLGEGRAPERREP